MILNNCYKTIEIDITTYKRKHLVHNNSKDMNVKSTDRYRKGDQNRFICSICLNKKPSQEDNRNIECCKRKSKSCPICQRYCEENKNNEQKAKADSKKILYGNDKYIQTTQLDVTTGLTLLNEVLSVFQNKKEIDKKKENASKTVVSKDVHVETDARKSKLTISKTLFFSVGGNDETNRNGEFSIVNSQPEPFVKSQFSIDLKHKSSSIPQMKLEELKKSLKEKTQSKDAIEEVNRMFATVRKHVTGESVDDSNRPMIRNGPRVLPVVKTDNGTTRRENQECYCHPTYRMSSGDSANRCCLQQERRNCCLCYKHRYVETVCGHLCGNANDFKQYVDIRD